MTPENIRKMPIPILDTKVEPSDAAIDDAANMAIEATKCAMLREIAAQLAELNEKAIVYLRGRR